MFIDTFEKHEFSKDNQLINEMLVVLSGSMDNPEVVLNRALEKCSRLYVGCGDGNQLLSFFFADFGSHAAIDGRPLHTLYLGLSATDESKKTSGAVLPLYSLCIADAAQWQDERGDKLWIWGATSNTFVLRVVYKYMAPVAPDALGAVDPAVVPLINALRTHLDVPSTPTDHLCVLRNAFRGYRYSSSEADRVVRMNRMDTCVLMKDLDVPACDSILFVCRVGPTRPPFHRREGITIRKRANPTAT